MRVQGLELIFGGFECALCRGELWPGNVTQLRQLASQCQRGLVVLKRRSVVVFVEPTSRTGNGIGKLRLVWQVAGRQGGLQGLGDEGVALVGLHAKGGIGLGVKLLYLVFEQVKNAFDGTDRLGRRITNYADAGFLGIDDAVKCGECIVSDFFGRVGPACCGVDQALDTLFFFGYGSFYAIERSVGASL